MPPPSSPSAFAAIVRAPPAPYAGEAPDISVRPSGRDTMAEIDDAMPDPHGVEVSARPSGRDTMAEIDAAFAKPEPVTAVRQPLRTLGFEERPRATGPVVRGRPGSAPEVITIDVAPMGRDTMAAIAAEALESDPDIDEEATSGVIEVDRASFDPHTLAAIAKEVLDRPDVPPPALPRSSPDEPMIQEVVTFVIGGTDTEKLKTREGGLDFIERYLLHRLPAWSLNDITRFDVHPTNDREQCVLQVWCRVTTQS